MPLSSIVPTRRVIRDITPVAISYIPFGILFGALSQNAGFSFLHTAGMSLLIYSGAAQLIAVNMLAGGAQALSVFVTGAILGLRHVLMGAALYPYVRRLEAGRRSALAVLMTDESFAFALRMYRGDQPDDGYFLGTNVYLYTTWNVSTIIGFTLGTWAPVMTQWGLDIIFPLLFTAVLVPMITSRREWIVTAGALAVAVLIRRWLPGYWYVVVTALLTATFGLVVDEWMQRSEGGESSCSH